MSDCWENGFYWGLVVAAAVCGIAVTLVLAARYAL